MIITIHECDRCQSQQKTDEQMWHIGITVNNARIDRSRAYPIGSERYWCRKCCDKFHLILDQPKPKPGELPPKEVTFEDKLREIIQDEIANIGGTK